MTHTTNFNLTQWAKTDRIRMADFNADNQKLDAALAACPRIHTAAYTGTGELSKAFQFPGKPVLLVILSEWSLTVCNRVSNIGITFLGSAAHYNPLVSWGDTGVTLTHSGVADAIANGQDIAYGLFVILEVN